MDKENDLDLIIDYINGELIKEQKINFEERLKLENDLVESLRFQKEIHQAFVKTHTREQVKSIHEKAKLLDRAEQNKGTSFSKNFQETTSYASKNIANKDQADFSILKQIAAVFIPIIFIGGLWSWFNHNTDSIKPISNYVIPFENDSTITPPSDKQKIEKNDSNQNPKEESYLKRIDVVQLYPDVSFGFAQKNEGSKKICFKRIINSLNDYNYMYRLNSDSLFIYLNANPLSEEFLFEIQHDEDSQSTLENGFYLKLENNFYVLNNNNTFNKLILLENKSRVIELNKLTRRK